MNDRRAFLVLMNHTFPFVNFIVYGIRVTFLDNQNVNYDVSYYLLEYVIVPPKNSVTCVLIN